MRRALPLLLIATAWTSPADAADPAATAPIAVKPLGANLEAFAYPFPVHWYGASSQGAPIRMAYLDVPPSARANGRTVLLLHGKNFCAATWQGTVTALSNAGYRVIAPDQIGFCKSSKPAGYQYSFQSLAALTRGLLDQARVGKVLVVGHSTGGILAARFALMYPDRVERIVLVNPLGLNDTLAQGVPYADLGTLRREEARTDAASIKAYQLRNYYHGQWRPAYDRWVAMLAGQYASPDGDLVREAQARLSDMIETQPVAADLDRIVAPVSLIIGQKDLTAFRANTAPVAVRSAVQTVPQAAEAVARRFSKMHLIRIADAGHAPQVEDPARFNAVLLDELR
ncbi:alpha/beta hydrolase [Sphingomonas sp. CARO-RG-8B-R24-01]|uniref:alpha/beta fold hydrolase n=1 Tax=Sphingomonas sp. CARO-RG-8B-R24-01 TaxID=2914831 RepID=UPI001F56213C|nr:alpha/beta hydrolase [Sphingomonas sp. CARO-RG-8B-R24-01]